jgi:hypothetical protein
MKVYTLWTFGAGTNHVVTSEAVAKRWKRSNKYRGYTEWEPDGDLPEVERAIKAEEARRKMSAAAAST